MNIGFLFHNRRIRDIDLSHPENGNPGIGGTEYMVLSVVYYLRRVPTKHRVTLYVEEDANLPEGIHTVKFDGFDDLLAKIAANGEDYFVARYSVSLLKSLQGASARLIFWLHNFVSHTELNMLYDTPRVAALVCVGHEQINQYRDYNAFDKSVVITNGYPIENLRHGILRDLQAYADRPNEVTYIGHISRMKGFHELAKAWPKVIAEVPDAVLNVIGTGQLYDRSARLGPYGIAEEGYEKEFMPFLTDGEGRVLDSVKFLGILGEEKFDVLKRTRVGVPNPTGVSETFCITAIEMQLCGCLATTIKANGLIDTVYSSGILYDSTDALADSIVALLRRDDNDYGQFAQWCMKFDFAAVALDWERLFDTLASGASLKDIRNDRYENTRGRYKWQELNRRLRHFLPFGRRLPTLFYYRAVLSKLLKPKR